MSFEVILTRTQETPIVSKNGKREGGTLGQLVVVSEGGEEVYSCYTMENAGTPTDESGKDKPIIARNYTLHWTDSSVCVPPEYRNKGAHGRHRAIWLHDPNNAKFANRRIMIHIGNDAIDSLGCILLGKGYNKETGKLTNSTQATLEFYQLCERYGIENFTLSIKDRA
ncbi:DUF5675 family protein [Helicobacter felis]|uniref:DUF5675 family protein n=1 Tax=Helicobacter felis TaxID=214 RepID=UPI000CF01EC8|nr:DUF5675 family protein [Helicobacter felis]